MKSLFAITLIVLGSAKFASVTAQNATQPIPDAPKGVNYCVEERNVNIPMAVFGNVPANAVFVGDIKPDKHYSCTPRPSAAVPMSRPTKAAAVVEAPAARPAKPRRNLGIVKR